MQQRLRREELESAQPLRIVGGQRRARAAARPSSSAARQRTRMSCSLLQLRRCCAFFRSRSSRSSRRSTTPRSARMSSSSIVRTSRAGSTRAGGMRHRRDRGTCARRGAARRRCGTAPRRAAPAAPALRAAGAGDVGELDGRGHVLLRVEQRGQLVEALVGHARHADVRVGLPAGARRVAGAGQQLKERGLARRRKPNESCAQHTDLTESCTSLARGRQIRLVQFASATS